MLVDPTSCDGQKLAESALCPHRCHPCLSMLVSGWCVGAGRMDGALVTGAASAAATARQLGYRCRGRGPWR